MSFTYGSEYVFNSATTEYISVTKLSSTSAIIVYKDAGNSSYGTALIATISEDTIIYGLEYTFNSADTIYISVAALDSTHAIIVYRDNGNSYYGTAIIATISGTSISFGSEYVFNSAVTNYNNVIAINSTTAIIGYKDGGNSSKGTVLIATVSGSTISFGSEYIFNSGSTNLIDMALLSSTDFIISYQDGGNSSKGTAIIGQISGSTVSFGSEYIFNSGITNNISVTALDSTNAIIAYQDSTNDNKGTAIVASISDTTISYGSEYVFSTAGDSSWISIDTIDNTNALIGYNANNKGYTIIATVSGTTISYDTPYEFNNAQTVYIVVTIFDSNNLILCYSDYGNANKGTAISGYTPSGATVIVKYYNGSSWATSTAVKYYDGVSWVDITALNRSDGATWVSV